MERYKLSLISSNEGEEYELWDLYEDIRFIKGYKPIIDYDKEYPILGMLTVIVDNEVEIIKCPQVGYFYYILITTAEVKYEPVVNIIYAENKYLKYLSGNNVNNFIFDYGMNETRFKVIEIINSNTLNLEIYVGSIPTGIYIKLTFNNYNRVWPPWFEYSRPDIISGVEWTCRTCGCKTGNCVYVESENEYKCLTNGCNTICEVGKECKKIGNNYECRDICENKPCNSNCAGYCNGPNQLCVEDSNGFNTCIRYQCKKPNGENICMGPCEGTCLNNAPCKRDEFNYHYCDYSCGSSETNCGGKCPGKCPEGYKCILPKYAPEYECVPNEYECDENIYRCGGDCKIDSCIDNNICYKHENGFYLCRYGTEDPCGNNNLCGYLDGKCPGECPSENSECIKVDNRYTCVTNNQCNGKCGGDCNGECEDDRQECLWNGTSFYCSGECGGNICNEDEECVNEKCEEICIGQCSGRCEGKCSTGYTCKKINDITWGCVEDEVKIKWYVWLLISIAIIFVIVLIITIVKHILKTKKGETSIIVPKTNEYISPITNI